MAQSIIEVRVSRWLLLMMFGFGALFLLIGLELGFFHVLFDDHTIAENSLGTWIFVAFSIGVGGLIVVSQFQYLMRPPVMLAVSSEGVSFGTGFRYRPLHIAAEHVTSVNAFVSHASSETRGFGAARTAGVEICMKKSDAIPAGCATSAGISYSNYILRLSKSYMNAKPQEVVDAVQQIIKNNA